MGLLNTRSVRNKVGLIHDVIDSGKLDILSLSETWLLETASPAEKSAVILNGYEALFTYRQRGGEGCVTGRRGCRGGGLAQIYRSTYEIKQINSSFRPTTYELLIARLSHGGGRVVILVIYRPPQTSVVQFTNELSSLLNEYIGDDVLICGDQNCPGVSELNIDAHQTNVLQHYNMTQHVKVATHLMGSILDLLIT